VWGPSAADEQRHTTLLCSKTLATLKFLANVHNNVIEHEKGPLDVQMI